MEAIGQKRDQIAKHAPVFEKPWSSNVGASARPASRWKV
jgi:hypothetical protein